jgi:hypothetical protein
MTSELQALADRQWRDYRDREPGTCFSDLGFTLVLARAYELQDAVTALRISTGDRLVGYKVGCYGGRDRAANSAWRDRSAPASSKVKCGDTARRWISMTSQVWRSKARWPYGWGQMARSRLSSPSSSCTTLSSGGPEDPRRARRQQRTQWRPRPAPRGLALVAGLRRETRRAECPDQRAPDCLRRAMATARRRAASLEWLRNHLTEAGLALPPGQIVLAGTPLGLYPALPGDQIAVFVNDEIGAECSVR